MKPGYYRYKLNDLAAGTYYFQWTVNGVVSCVNKVVIKPICPNDMYIKYLDSKGYYRFFIFNSYWQQRDETSLIGKVNNLVTSIQKAQSSSKNIGYKNTRKLILTAGNVSAQELELLKDIYTSPRVYIKTKDGDSQWVLVTVVGDGIGKNYKSTNKSVTLEIELPEQYTISMF